VLGNTVQAIGHADPAIRHPVAKVDGKVVLKERYALV
jgi:hypothetical protein